MGVLIIQLDPDDQTNQKGDPLETSKHSGKKNFHNAEEKTSKTKPSELSSNEKRFNIMVPKADAFWKHPKLLSNKVGWPGETL